MLRRPAYNHAPHLRSLQSAGQTPADPAMLAPPVSPQHRPSTRLDASRATTSSATTNLTHRSAARTPDALTLPETAPPFRASSAQRNVERYSVTKRALDRSIQYLPSCARCSSPIQAPPHPDQPPSNLDPDTFHHFCRLSPLWPFSLPFSDRSAGSSPAPDSSAYPRRRLPPLPISSPSPPRLSQPRLLPIFSSSSDETSASKFSSDTHS